MIGELESLLGSDYNHLHEYRRLRSYSHKCHICD